MYEVYLMKQAEKYLTSCPKKLKEHIIRELGRLETEPAERGEKLKGSLGQYYSVHATFKSVHYRAVFVVLEQEARVAILYMGKREKFYEKFKKYLAGK